MFLTENDWRSREAQDTADFILLPLAILILPLACILLILSKSKIFQFPGALIHRLRAGRVI